MAVTSANSEISLDFMLAIRPNRSLNVHERALTTINSNREQVEMAATRDFIRHIGTGLSMIGVQVFAFVSEGTNDVASGGLYETRKNERRSGFLQVFSRS